MGQHTQLSRSWFFHSSLFPNGLSYPHADTSAMNWERLEEWDGHPAATLFDWNKDQWSSIDETSQPYYPGEDTLAPSDMAIGILEVPDNGLLVDYVTGDEMIEMFDANGPGQPHDEPRAYSIGYHAPNFSEAFKERMDEALTHIDQFLASDDAGPVVYATLSEMALVWPTPQ
jgi:hypothetical protein